MTLCAKSITQSTNALPLSGEVVLEQIFASHTATPVLPPLQFLWSSSKRLFTAIMSAIKDRKKLIPVLIMTFIWLILTLLPMLGIKIKLLDFLTFARGGTISGAGGLIGASLGKGLISYFIFSFIMPLFSGGKPFAKLGTGLKNLFSAFSVKSFSTYGYLLLGAGASLIAYNFMTGNASLQNSMVGIVSFFISLKALSSRRGFLRGLLLSFTGRLSGDRQLDISFINRFMAGWTLGFAIAIPLSSIGIGLIGYGTGILAVIAGVVLLIFLGSKRKAVA